MDGWYYAQNGQSVGPISQAELKGLVASGQVKPDDQVWHESMANWAPARKVPGLMPTRAAVAQAPVAAAPQAYAQTQYQQPAYAAQPEQVLGYQGTNVGGEVVATPRAIGYLKQTRPWVIFMAVLMFIGAALLAILALFMLGGGGAMLSGRSRGSSVVAGFAAGAAIAYFIGAFIYFIFGFYLIKFGSAIGRLTVTRNSSDLENAMLAQMSFWRLCGIIAIVVISLYLLLFLLAIGLAAR